ncbi:hypothetical protein [Nocardioides massiliensis]|uniref:Uncharacterized protein n=1 Tax=Nocardioides massiliensis TaxID=1325935 RepID=A0ABT9NN43_9ACTN|nr:hypothetical protein [Nocardioides massiliensis]MDP9821841.1 hypothetical protein [Nocardioides massiliensis]
MDWQPLPPEVAEWMGMDHAGVPDVAVWSEDASPQDEAAAPAVRRRGVLGLVRRPRRRSGSAA